MLTDDVGFGPKMMNFDLLNSTNRQTLERRGTTEKLKCPRSSRSPPHFVRASGALQPSLTTLLMILCISKQTCRLNRQTKKNIIIANLFFLVYKATSPYLNFSPFILFYFISFQIHVSQVVKFSVEEDEN